MRKESPRRGKDEREERHESAGHGGEFDAAKSGEREREAEREAEREVSGNSPSPPFDQRHLTRRGGPSLFQRARSFPGRRSRRDGREDGNRDPRLEERRRELQGARSQIRRPRPSQPAPRHVEHEDARRGSRRREEALHAKGHGKREARVQAVPSHSRRWHHLRPETQGLQRQDEQEGEEARPELRSRQCRREL